MDTMTLTWGRRGASFRRVGMCGREQTMEASSAWLMMYSVVSGPSVSYRETV